MKTYNKERGDDAERRFIECVLKLRPTAVITKTDEKTDIEQHIDYIINTFKASGLTVDVKAKRYIKDLPNEGQNYTVLEIMNKKGELGAIYGKAKYMAIESGNTNNEYCFVLIDREKLVDIMLQLRIDEPEEHQKPFKEQYKRHTNRNTINKISRSWDRDNDCFHIDRLQIIAFKNILKESVIIFPKN